VHDEPTGADPLDRFNHRVEVGRPGVAELLHSSTGQPTRHVAARVELARRVTPRRGVLLSSSLRHSMASRPSAADLTRRQIHALRVPLALDNYRFWMAVVDNTKDRPWRR
jgi:hypothetical protein